MEPVCYTIASLISRRHVPGNFFQLLQRGASVLDDIHNDDIGVRETR
jgi:hypothetical protein